VKSVMARLEALEKKRPSSPIFEITMDDGSVKEVDFASLMALKKEPYWENGIYYPGVPEFRIIRGGNLKEVDEILVTVIGKKCADILSRR